MMVAVSAPVAGLDMNLYIPLDQSPGSGYDCITEVSSLAIITPPGVEYFYCLTMVSCQPGSIN